MNFDSTSYATSTGKAPALPMKHQIVKDDVEGIGSVYRVVGLPMFAEHQREWNGTNYTVDGAYLNDLASWMKDRAAEGWRPAIHAEHNGPLAGPRKRLAFADAPYVAPGIVEGQSKDVLFFDALCKTLEDAKELQNRPYRSPEVNLAKRTVESVAAMESEGPWFKFPITRFEAPAGETMPYAAPTVGYGAVPEGSEGLLAFAFDPTLTHYSALYLFPNAQYEGMPMFEKNQGEEPEAMPPEGTESGEPAGNEQEEAQYADDALPAAPEAPSMDGISQLVQILVPILKGLIQPAAPAAPPAPMPIAPPGMAPSTGPVAMSHNEGVAMYSSEDVAALLAQSDARNAAQYGALKAQVEASTKRANTEAALLWAKNQTRGLSRPADFESQVAKFAALNPDVANDTAPLALYVSTLKSVCHPNPSEVHSDEPVPTPYDSKAAAALITADPGKAGLIREAVTMYAALKPSARSAMSEEKFIKGHINRAERMTASYAARN